MSRDMDLIRELLLYSEENCSGQLGGTINLDDFKDYNYDDLTQHIYLLKSGGFIGPSSGSSSSTGLGSLTWEGADFLDSVRDPEIWRKTKAAGEKVGGWTVSLLAEYAKGLIKLQFDSLLSGASS